MLSVRQVVVDITMEVGFLRFVDLAIENADVRLVHRDIEASKIVHVGSPLPNRRRSYRPAWKSSRPLPDVEKLLLIAAGGVDSFLLATGDSADDGRAAGDAGGVVRHVPDSHMLRRID